MRLFLAAFRFALVVGDRAFSSHREFLICRMGTLRHRARFRIVDPASHSAPMGRDNSGVHCLETEETHMESSTKFFGTKTLFRTALLLSSLALSACAEPGPYYASYPGYDYYPGY